MLALLPKVGDNSWALNFGAYVANRVINIEPDPTALVIASPVPVGFFFLFNAATFAGELLSLTPTNDPLSGISSFASAWENTIKMSIYPIGINLLPGAAAPPFTPDQTFSVVTSVVITPASILAGKNKIIELATAPPVADPKQSLFPVKFREAFLELKINIVGINSVAPTPGPLQLMDIPLI
jgi:hypothetical protein